jgi:hypothetical protein
VLVKIFFTSCLLRGYRLIANRTDDYPSRTWGYNFKGTLMDYRRSVKVDHSFHSSKSILRFRTSSFVHDFPWFNPHINLEYISGNSPFLSFPLPVNNFLVFETDHFDTGGSISSPILASDSLSRTKRQTISASCSSSVSIVGTAFRRHMWSR